MLAMRLARTGRSLGSLVGFVSSMGLQSRLSKIQVSISRQPLFIGNYLLPAATWCSRNHLHHWFAHLCWIHHKYVTLGEGPWSTTWLCSTSTENNHSFWTFSFAKQVYRLKIYICNPFYSSSLFNSYLCYRLITTRGSYMITYRTYTTYN